MSSTNGVPIIKLVAAVLFALRIRYSVTKRRIVGGIETGYYTSIEDARLLSDEAALAGNFPSANILITWGRNAGYTTEEINHTVRVAGYFAAFVPSAATLIDPLTQIRTQIQALSYPAALVDSRLLVWYANGAFESQIIGKLATQRMFADTQMSLLPLIYQSAFSLPLPPAHVQGFRDHHLWLFEYLNRDKHHLDWYQDFPKNLRTQFHRETDYQRLVADYQALLADSSDRDMTHPVWSDADIRHDPSILYRNPSIVTPYHLAYQTQHGTIREFLVHIDSAPLSGNYFFILRYQPMDEGSLTACIGNGNALWDRQRPDQFAAFVDNYFATGMYH